MSVKYYIIQPERLSADSYSYESDVWSTGITILECLIGDHPIIQNRNTGVIELLSKVM